MLTHQKRQGLRLACDEVFGQVLNSNCRPPSGK